MRNHVRGLLVLAAALLALAVVPSAHAAAPSALRIKPGAENGGLSTEFKALLRADAEKRAGRARLLHVFEWGPSAWPRSGYFPFMSLQCVDTATADDPPNCWDMNTQRYQGAVSTPGFGNGTWSALGNSPYPTGVDAYSSGALANNYAHMAVGAEAVPYFGNQLLGASLQTDCKNRLDPTATIGFRTIVFNSTYSQRYGNTDIRPMIGLAANVVNGSSGPPWRTACVYSIRLTGGADNNWAYASGSFFYWGRYDWAE